MTTVNARVLRRTVTNKIDLYTGALALANYQWGLATAEDVLVCRDGSGAFHEFSSDATLPALIESLSYVKDPVATYGALPSGANGDMCMALDTGTYYRYNGALWDSVTNSDKNPKFNSFSLNSNPLAVTLNEGVMQWNVLDHTLDIGLTGGSVLQVGQENHVRALNNTGATLTEGTVVYISGSQGNRVTIAKANASNYTGKETIGVLTQDVLDNQITYVTTFGLVRSANTTGILEGDPIYLSDTAGVFAATPPAKPAYQVPIGYCVREHAVEGVLFVSVRPSCKLGELSDVETVSPVTGDSLQYDASTELWSAVNIPLLTKEHTGFVNPAGITVTYSATERTVTLTGDLRYLWRDVERTLGSSWTSSSHGSTTDTEYFLKSIDGENFVWSTSPWDFSDIHVALAWYGASNKFGVREVHGCTMSAESHKNSHLAIGTFRLSGFGLTAGTYAIGGTTDAQNRPGVDSGVLRDEDLETTVSAFVDGGAYTQLYGNTSNTPVLTTGAAGIAPVGTSYIQYNNAGTLTELSTNNYMNVYLVTMPVAAGTDSESYRYLWVPGSYSYTSQTAAEAETPQVNVGTLSSLSPEYAVVYRLTLRTSASYSTNGQFNIASEARVGGSRANPIVFGGTGTSDHNSLSNLQLAGAGVTWGHVDNLAQTFAGEKTWSGNALFSGAIGVTGNSNISSWVLRNAFSDYPGGTAWAVLGHKDLTQATTHMALYQDNTGTTTLNAATGKILGLCVGGIGKITITGSLVTVDNDLNVVGSTTLGDSSLDVNTIRGNAVFTDQTASTLAIFNGSKQLVSSTVTTSNLTDLTDGGDSTLHYHAEDRKWANITSKPTTIAGYGITDAVTTSDSRLSDARTPLAHNQAWSTITSKPTTIAGYGITDLATAVQTSFGEAHIGTWSETAFGLAGRFGHKDFNLGSNWGYLQFATGAGAMAFTSLQIYGATTLNDAVTLGSSSTDDLTINARLVGNFVPKTNDSSVFGGASNRFANIYSVLGNFSGDVAGAGSTWSGLVKTSYRDFNINTARTDFALSAFNTVMRFGARSTLAEVSAGQLTLAHNYNADTTDKVIANGRGLSLSILTGTATTGSSGYDFYISDYDTAGNDVTFAKLFSVRDNGVFAFVPLTGTSMSMSGNCTFGDSGTDEITTNARWISDLYPKVNASVGFGAPSLRWTGVYGVVGDFSTSVATNTLILNGQSHIMIPEVIYTGYASAGQQLINSSQGWVLLTSSWSVGTRTIPAYKLRAGGKIKVRFFIESGATSSMTYRIYIGSTIVDTVVSGSGLSYDYEITTQSKASSSAVVTWSQGFTKASSGAAWVPYSDAGTAGGIVLNTTVDATVSVYAVTTSESNVSVGMRCLSITIE